MIQRGRKMFRVIKNKGKYVKAYRLGDKNPVVDQLIAEGKIKVLPNGEYEVFSQEVIRAQAEHGEAASAGDYVKVDGTGSPYPNDASFFAANHRHIAGDDYEQIPKPMSAWSAEEPMCEEIRFLIREKGLVLNPEDPERYYTAPLWGTVEAGRKDAVLIMYSVSRGNDGDIKDISYNLITREQFEKDYSVIIGGKRAGDAAQEN